jgi:hypothetical protein
MKKSILFIVIVIAMAVLVGCNTVDTQIVDRDTVESSIIPETMYFAYPAAGQQSVPISTPVILRYTSPITTAENDLASLFALKTTAGERLSFKSAELTENNQGIILTPKKSLEPATDYVIVSDNVKLTNNRIGSLPREALSFRTAPAIDGPLMRQIDGTEHFSLKRIAPYSLTDSSMAIGSNKYPLTDMSTLRLQFSEPIESTSLIYNLPKNGGTVTLKNSAGELVAASMFVKGHRLTIDPKADFNPDEDYQLILSAKISSTIGDALLESIELTVSPITSRSPGKLRERVAQIVANDGGQQQLTGKTNNSVGLDSILLGTGNQTIQSGNVYADLAFIPDFERRKQSVPLRIAAGTKLTGTNVEVNVAGKFPAGFESGAVNVQFLSDANGYLMLNPYTDDPNAPRIIELYADLSITTDNTIANACLAQSLLHVQLVGTAIVEEGNLTLEASGVIELNILGVDTASSLISFRLEGFRNVTDIPATSLDVVSPIVKSWVPGGNSDLLRPGDPVVVFFSEPLDPLSMTADSVSVSANGTMLDGKLTLNGSAVMFSPSAPFTHNTDYTLNLTNELFDFAGNSLSPVQESFRLPNTDIMPEGAPTNQAPLALTAQPGYPCAKTASDLTLGNQGRCLGGKLDDDLIPILVHPGIRALTVGFSQNINPSSINADTVIVERRLKNDAWVPENVEIKLTGRNLKVTPISPWQSDTLYRYTLVSGDNGIKSSANLPLQTQFLTQGFRAESERTTGGPNMVNYFLGGGEETSVFIPLKSLSAADINSDLRISSSEKGVSISAKSIPNSSKVKIPPESVESEDVRINLDDVPLLGSLPFLGDVLDSLGIYPNPVIGAQIGCEVDTYCPEKSFIYMTSAMDSAIGGDIIDGRALVKLHPTTIYTSSLDVYVKLDPLLALGLSLTGGIDAIPTGPMSMRMRFQKDANEERNELINGYISTNNKGQLTFETELDVYIDAPYLAPNVLGSTLDHNLRSFPINKLKISGPITFLDDGRMQIEQRNLEIVTLEGVNINGNVMVIGNIDMTMTMSIPKNKLYLNYLSPITQSH